MTPSFSLIHEPWIPCITLAGERRELSLQDVLCHAHELRELYDESPLVTAALHRLLLAVLHRVFGPQDEDAWANLWQVQQWPAEPLREYFEQWADRFDLFHPERPFYQQLDERVQDKDPKSVINLVHSSGNNPTLFSHQNETQGACLTPSEAARLLITAQAFHVAGLSGLPQKFTDSTCARGVLFLVEGESLFETLTLNLIWYPTPGDVLPCRPEDKPAWEMHDPYRPDREIPFGYLDYLTWQSCRIMLLPDENDKGETVVSQMRIAPALKLAPNIYDPMKHFRMDQAGPKPLRFNENRVLWRDSAALFRLTEQEESRPPAVFHWLAGLVDDGHLNRHQTWRFMALGMASHQAKVFFYRHERFPLPLAYFDDVALVDRLRDALQWAEDVYRQLRSALNGLARLIIAPESDQEGGRTPDKDDVQRMIDHWGVSQRYWSTLETPFLHLLEDLPVQGEPVVIQWHDELRRAARHAFQQAADIAGTDVRAIKAAVRARGYLERGLAKVLPEPQATGES